MSQPDRAYIGEIRYHDEWYPGTQTPLVDRATFDRVQVLLGGHKYQSHELLFSGELIRCGHCEHPITGELKKRKTKKGVNVYRYYRCARYTKKGHPRTRVREEQIEEQVLTLFDSLRVDDEKVRHWIRNALRARTKDQRLQTADTIADLNRQIKTLEGQQDQLLNLRLLEEIDQRTYAAKSTEFRDRIAKLSLHVDAERRAKDESSDVAVKAFELSQTLKQKWLTADIRAKRQLLAIMCLNLTLVDVNLVVEWRKPFDMLAEGLLSDDSRADKI